MFKMAQNTLSSWAITDLTIILLLGAIYKVYTRGSAATTTKRSGHTVVVVVQVQMQNGTGLKKRFSRSVFYWAGLLACLLACATIRTRTCLDYRLLGCLTPWLIDYYRGSMFMLMFPMIIIHEASTGAYQPTLGPGQGPPGKEKWRWIQQDRPDQARSCLIRLHAALVTCLFVCSLPYFSCYPYTESALLPWFMVGMTRIMFYVLRIHLHTHACVCIGTWIGRGTNY